MTRRWVAVAVALALAGCTDQGPVSAPGVLTATLISPNGAEGAAVVTLIGEGVGEAIGLGDVMVFQSTAADVTSLVLVSPDGGDLAFQVALADTVRLPDVSIEQVAGPDDELRGGGLPGYRIEWSR